MEELRAERDRASGTRRRELSALVAESMLQLGRLEKERDSKKSLLRDGGAALSGVKAVRRPADRLLEEEKLNLDSNDV